MQCYLKICKMKNLKHANIRDAGSLHLDGHFLR